MIGSSRLIRNIFGILSAWVLLVIIISWANQPYIYYDSTTVVGTSLSKHANFHGFKEFFDYLETYPGLLNTQLAINNYCNIVGNFHVSNYNALDVAICIFRLITTPVVLTVTIFTDLIMNVEWFFKILWTFQL